MDLCVTWSYLGVTLPCRILIARRKRNVQNTDTFIPSGGAMNSLCTNLYLRVRNLIEREEGQDLVEYALVVALIAFGAIAGMQFLATGINNAFSDISNVLTSNIT